MGGWVPTIKMGHILSRQGSEIGLDGWRVHRRWHSQRIHISLERILLVEGDPEFYVVSFTNGGANVAPNELKFDMCESWNITIYPNFILIT